MEAGLVAAAALHDAPQGLIECADLAECGAQQKPLGRVMRGLRAKRDTKQPRSAGRGTGDHLGLKRACDDDRFRLIRRARRHGLGLRDGCFDLCLWAGHGLGGRGR